MYAADESNITLWFWLALIVIVNITWISMDAWLRTHNHEYLTTEFREGLRNQILGPFIVGALCFTVGAFVWHMFTGPAT